MNAGPDGLRAARLWSGAVNARIGLATGYDPAQGVRQFTEAVRQVDERGWEIAFFSETLALMRDSVTALAAFATATKRITLGCTQVVRLRSPVMTRCSMSIWAISTLSNEIC